jgi:hypothetical protein
MCRLSFLSFSEMSAESGEVSQGPSDAQDATLQPDLTEAVVKDEPDDHEPVSPHALAPHDPLDEAAESDCSNQSRLDQSRKRNR